MACYAPRKRCSITASHEPYNNWRSHLDGILSAPTSHSFYNGGASDSDELLGDNNFCDNDDASTLKMDHGELLYLSTSDGVNAALDKIEQLLSKDEELLKNLETHHRISSPESVKNISQSLAIQSNKIIDRVHTIEGIICDPERQVDSVPANNLLVQKTIQQLDHIRSNMIDRPLAPKPPRFHQTIGRAGDDDYGRASKRRRAHTHAADHKLLHRKQHEISLLAQRNEAALHLKKQWQKSTEDARLDLAWLQRWIEQLVPLSIGLLNPSADAALDSTHGQVYRFLLERPNCVSEGMGKYINEKIDGITSALSE